MNQDVSVANQAIFSGSVVRFAYGLNSIGSLHCGVRVTHRCTESISFQSRSGQA